MRALAFLEKTFLENLRDWKILSIALVFAPFFVCLMYGYYVAATPAYGLLVVNDDRGGSAAEGLLATWRGARHPDGKPVFVVKEVTDLDAGREKVAARDADLLVEIPAGFSASLEGFGRGGAGAAGSQPIARVINHGDEASVRSSMAMALSDYYAFGYASVATGAVMPMDVEARAVGAGRPRSEFDLYVPSLLVLAIVMILFTAAASLVREVDRGTMTRLMASRLTTLEMLTAVSVNQVLIGVASLGLAILAAVSVGYRTEGSYLAVLAVGALATLGVVALSVITAAFLRTIFELLTIGVFPFFVLMFFSECMFPLPRIVLFRLAGHAVHANDFLPTTLAVRALGRILTQGAGLGDVIFEIAGMAILTVAYFALGAWLFRRRHLRT